ncbi:MAG: hypothetical protein IKQ36_01820 [Clostridia bacterium]|nr:hypothetical protein [Clostridia bacterium]
MNSREFLESIGDIDNGLINGARDMEAKPKRRLARLVPAAAALVLALGAAAVTMAVMKPKTPADDKAASAPVPTEAVKPAGLPTEHGGDIVAEGDEGGSEESEWRYLIHDSRFYDLISVIDGAQALVGERIGEVSEVMDPEWFFDSNAEVSADAIEGGLPAHTAMPLKERAGGMKGPVYALRGYDPEYVVGQLDGSGRLRVYYSAFGAEHRRGADLFETFFGGFDGLEFRSKLILHRSPEEYYEEVWEPIGAGHGESVAAFIAALDAAEWRDEGELFPEGVSTADRVGYLRLTKPDGMRIDIVLWENGCVWVYEAQRLENGRVLCLDKDAAEGVASLIRGRSEFLDPDKMPEATLLDCVNDPLLGAAAPKRAPEGFASRAALYTEDDVRCAELIFRPQGDDFPDVHVDIVPAEHKDRIAGLFDGEAAEFRPLDGFSRELIRECSDGEYEHFEAFVLAGGCAVRITAEAPVNGGWDLPGLIMSVLDSING